MAFLKSRNGITLFTVITAVLHLLLGLRSEGMFLVLFILNGVGYLALLYATFWTPEFLKSQKSLIRWIFILFTALTIVLYFVFNGADAFVFTGAGLRGLGVKLIEVFLLIGLWQSKK